MNQTSLILVASTSFDTHFTSWSLELRQVKSLTFPILMMSPSISACPNSAQSLHHLRSSSGTLGLTRVHHSHAYLSKMTRISAPMTHAMTSKSLSITVQIQRGGCCTFCRTKSHQPWFPRQDRMRCYLLILHRLHHSSSNHQQPHSAQENQLFPL